MTNSKQRSNTTDELLQDSLKLALTQNSPDCQKLVDEMQAQTSTNEQGKSVLSVYVAFTTNIMCRVIFTNIFA
jgi:hypothetical protein